MMNKLEELIVSWGHDKGILSKVSLDSLTKEELYKRREAQYGKTVEEVEELYQAIANNDIGEAKDAIGDVIVTLIMQAQLWDLSLGECLQSAYDEIKTRTGRMINGVFVKNV